MSTVESEARLLGPDPFRRGRERHAAQKKALQKGKPPPIKCEGCKKRIKGTVYFHAENGLPYKPCCLDCTSEGKWQRLADWYRVFRPDEPLPSRDEDLPALRLPRCQPCEVCGREISWVYRRRSRRQPALCCYACKDERENRKRRVDHEPRSCDACGDPFTPKRSDARTCSDRCRQRMHRSRVTDNGHLPGAAQVAVTSDAQSRIAAGRICAADSRDTRAVRGAR